MKPHRANRGGIGAWILVVGALVFSGLAFAFVQWLTKAPETEALQQKRAVVTVATAAATKEKLVDTLVLNGTVEAKERLKIGSEVSGLKVIQVLADEGDFITRGQTLVVMNTSLSESRLAQLQARYDQLLAALEKAKTPQRPLELDQLESAVRQAESVIDQEQSNKKLVEIALQNAQQNLNRYSSLYQGGAVAQTEAENRKLEVDRQRAQLLLSDDRIAAARFSAQQARERLRLAQSGGREEDVSIVAAQLRELKAQMDEVQLLIGQGQVTAPTSGWVLKRSVGLGDVVNGGTVLFEVAKDGEIELRGRLPEVQLSKVSVGQPVKVSHSGKSISGRVWKLSPLVDSADRNAEVRIELPASSGLRPGMFAEGTIDLGDTEAVMIATEAIRGEANANYVFLLEGTTAKKQAVELGRRKGSKVEVAQGLKVGQQVIVEGGGFLRDGDTVSTP